eukprot:gene12610-8646_t
MAAAGGAADIEELVKRITCHHGVRGFLIINGEGIPIRHSFSEASRSLAVQHAALLQSLAVKTKQMIQEMDVNNELQVIRLRSKKHEIVVAPDNNGWVSPLCSLSRARVLVAVDRFLLPIIMIMGEMLRVGGAYYCSRFHRSPCLQMIRRKQRGRKREDGKTRCIIFYRRKKVETSTVENLLVPPVPRYIYTGVYFAFHSALFRLRLYLLLLFITTSIIYLYIYLFILFHFIFKDLLFLPPLQASTCASSSSRRICSIAAVQRKGPDKRPLRPTPQWQPEEANPRMEEVVDEERRHQDEAARTEYLLLRIIEDGRVSAPPPSSSSPPSFPHKTEHGVKRGGDDGDGDGDGTPLRGDGTGWKEAPRKDLGVAVPGGNGLEATPHASSIRSSSTQPVSREASLAAPAAPVLLPPPPSIPLPKGPFRVQVPPPPAEAPSSSVSSSTAAPGGGGTRSGAAGVPSTSPLRGDTAVSPPAAAHRRGVPCDAPPHASPNTKQESTSTAMEPEPEEKQEAGKSPWQLWRTHQVQYFHAWKQLVLEQTNEVEDMVHALLEEERENGDDDGALARLLLSFPRPSTEVLAYRLRSLTTTYLSKSAAAPLGSTATPSYMEKHFFGPMREQASYYALKRREAERETQVLRLQLSAQKKKAEDRQHRRDKLVQCALLEDLVAERQAECHKLDEKKCALAKMLERMVVDKIRREAEEEDKKKEEEEVRRRAITTANEAEKSAEATTGNEEREGELGQLSGLALSLALPLSDDVVSPREHLGTPAETTRTTTGEGCQPPPPLAAFLELYLLPQVERLWAEVVQVPPASIPFLPHTRAAMQREQQQQQRGGGPPPRESDAEDGDDGPWWSSALGPTTRRQAQKAPVASSPFASSPEAQLLLHARRTVGGGVSSLLEETGWAAVHRAQWLVRLQACPYYQYYGGATEDHLKSKPLHIFFKTLRQVARTAYVDEEVYRLTLTGSPSCAVPHSASKRLKLPQTAAPAAAAFFRFFPSVEALEAFAPPLDMLERKVWHHLLYAPWRERVEGLAAFQCRVLQHLLARMYRKPALTNDVPSRRSRTGDSGAGREEEAQGLTRVQLEWYVRHSDGESATRFLLRFGLHQHQHQHQQQQEDDDPLEVERSPTAAAAHPSFMCAGRRARTTAARLGVVARLSPPLSVAAHTPVMMTPALAAAVERLKRRFLMEQRFGLGTHTQQLLLARTSADRLSFDDQAAGDGGSSSRTAAVTPPREAVLASQPSALFPLPTTIHPPPPPTGEQGFTIASSSTRRGRLCHSACLRTTAAPCRRPDSSSPVVSRLTVADFMDFQLSQCAFTFSRAAYARREAGRAAEAARQQQIRALQEELAELLEEVYLLERQVTPYYSGLWVSPCLSLSLCGDEIVDRQTSLLFCCCCCFFGSSSIEEQTQDFIFSFSLSARFLILFLSCLSPYFKRSNPHAESSFSSANQTSFFLLVFFFSLASRISPPPPPRKKKKMSSSTIPRELPAISDLSKETYNALFKQTCSVGCITGILVAAAIVAILMSGLMCYLFWPGLETISRQERRVLAAKRIRERNAAREEKRLQEEEFGEEA